MSLLDQWKNSAVSDQNVDTSPLQAAGHYVQDPSVDQLPFPENPAPLYGNTPSYFSPSTPPALTPPPAVYNPFEEDANAPKVTRLLDSPAATRNLPDLHPGLLPMLPDTQDVQRSTTTNLRQPVLIRGDGKKSTGSIRPPQGRRLVIHGAVTCVLAVIVLGTLFAVVPVGSEARGNFNIFNPIMDIVGTKSNNTGTIAQQAATATAVTQDGFDPGSQTYAGLPTAPPSVGGGGGGLNRFFYGQCTYWANMRYHALTGIWVPWLGNANQWYYGGRSYGWVVSGTPNPSGPSIIVLQAGVQGAGWYGHVAIVEHINPDGSVLTSNYNWLGNWAVETYVTFRPGPGVSFVWAPGK